MKTVLICCSILMLASAYSCTGKNSSHNTDQPKTKRLKAKSDAEWQKQLSDEQYQVMVRQGTEPPFKNAYWDNHKKGVYVSAATGDTLFSSDTKFESGTGWPSFWAPVDPKKVEIRQDNSFGMVREEVIEKSTGLHLGHLFDDGPKPTGKRYCMNSAALRFVPSR